MSNAEHRIKRFELARLLDGSTKEATLAADGRLRKYEVDEIVTPEIRREPLALNPAHAFKKARIGSSHDPKAASDAWWEAKRYEGHQPLKPTPAPTLFEEHYYGRDDAKKVAPHERAIAPLCEKFCQFAFGSERDPAALPVAVSLGVAHVLTGNENAVVTRILTLRLQKRGALFDRRNKPVKLSRLLQNKKLIVSARRNEPVRGATALWSESAVLEWLEAEGYVWSIQQSGGSKPSCEREAAIDIEDLWLAPSTG